jgi:hypothetical protein
MARTIKRLLNSIPLAIETALAGATTELLADMDSYIFTDAKALQGESYSTKPMYVSIKTKERGNGFATKFGSQLSNKSLRPIGKTGKKTKSTQYLKRGYAEFREKVGRRSDKVNLDLTGQLRASLRIGKDSNRAFTIGIAGQFAANKAQWMEDKYNKKIFGVTSSQKKAFFTNFNKILRREFQRLNK